MDTQSQWARLLDAVRSSQPPADRDHAVAGALQIGMTVADGIVGCSITEVRPHGACTPASSNVLAIQLDQAQYRAGSGPCIAAAVQGRAQQVDDMTIDDRFARFAEASLAHGVHSSLSLPLSGARLPAALNLYAARPGLFQPSHTQAVADLLARCTSALLRDHDSSAVHHALPSSAHARGELVRRAQQALAETQDLTKFESYTQLADWSRQQNRSILVIAAELLERTGQQHSDADGGGEAS
ncbi:MAG: uncharacterized protein JWM76_2869 [Pseudonocardiales bacterium]|nr:uncharacterized protein [Pseudonocardiales bacterium]